jgi:cytoskeletal protein CcmA (bactofilin family)
MWGSNSKQQTEKVDTLIGQHTELRGDIVYKGGLHVDGRIKGNVIAENESSTILVLSEGGSIEGEVKVPYIVINGTVNGDLHAQQSVELGAKARINGNVYYNKIEMAMGAEVNGSLVHINEAAKSVVSFQQEKKTHFAAEKKS